jgi:hypothetical protein
MKLLTKPEQLVIEVVQLRVLPAVGALKRRSVVPAEAESAGDTDRAHRVEVVGGPEYLRSECLRLWIVSAEAEVVVDGDTVLDFRYVLRRYRHTVENSPDDLEGVLRVTAGAPTEDAVGVVGQCSAPDDLAVCIQFGSETLGEAKHSADVAHVVPGGGRLAHACENAGKGWSLAAGATVVVAGRWNRVRKRLARSAAGVWVVGRQRVFGSPIQINH